MAENELIQMINSHIDAHFEQSISTQELQQKLAVLINNLINKDFQKLLIILYKVDVDENKLKNILKAEAGKDAANIIATLIIEREIQKIKTRKQFGSKK